jgi:Mn2+/Fe2+ NRAMP family transporter
MIIGALIAILYGQLPLQLIVFAQRVTIFIVPIIGLAIFVLANDRSVMGATKNNYWQNIFGIAGLGLILFLAAKNFIAWFLT